MAAENRKALVEAICKRYPQAFRGDPATQDARRRLLMPIIVREANKLDGEKWFLLNRMDREDEDPRPGRLTSDVMVWGPTKEHFDVLTADGPMWKNHGPVTDRDWKLEHWTNWPSWDDIAEPSPQPDPVEPDKPSTPPDLEGRVSNLESVIAKLREALR